MRVFLRKITNPAWVAAEGLLYITAGSLDLQHFRRLQHRVFGLSSKEWDALETLLSSTETETGAVHRSAVLKTETLRLAKELEALNAKGKDRAGNDVPVDPKVESAKSELRTTYFDLTAEHSKVLKIASDAREEREWAKRKLWNTPVGRAQRSRHRTPRQTGNPGLHREKCIQRGGCCARDCGCCYEARKGGELATVGYRAHCSRDCPCCRKFFSQDIELGTTVRKGHPLGVDLRETTLGSAGKKRMDQDIWRLA